jgi:hypothetical protein
MCLGEPVEHGLRYSRYIAGGRRARLEPHIHIPADYMTLMDHPTLTGVSRPSPIPASMAAPSSTRAAGYWEGGADEFHGEGGPVLTSKTADQPLLCRKLIQAGTEIRLEYHADVNHLPPAPATVSARFSRPAAEGGARVRRAPICVRH